MQTYHITDLKDCRKLWKTLFRPLTIADTWEFRACFQNQYHNLPRFILLEDRGGIAGMLPLSYLAEEDQHVFFPGETWKGKTWLERTPVYLREPRFISDLLAQCPANACLRYMKPMDWPADAGDIEVDEIAYTLQPAAMNFDITRYRERFSTKRLKSISRGIDALTAPGSRLHVNRLPDFKRMIAWNLERYGSDSYFSDRRFTNSFKSAMSFLHREGLLRLVSLEIGEETAAVDLGAVFKGTYTVFAGGTNPLFPGVAKAINMHHIEFAFRQKLSSLDFLCGDFYWKKLWHLDPQALFKFVKPPGDQADEALAAAFEPARDHLVRYNQQPATRAKEECYAS